jgi:hypothetical protein
MPQIRHPNARKGYNPEAPGGEPSCAYQATPVGPPVETQCIPTPPRQDDDSNDRFHRGANRVWNKVRPRAKKSK